MNASPRAPRRRRVGGRAPLARSVVAPLAFAAAVVAGCGARTAPSGGDPSGTGGAASAAPSTGSGGDATGEGGASPATSTGAVAGDCEARDVDLGGTGAIVVRTEGELAFVTTADGRVVRADLESGETLALAADREDLGDLAIFEGALYFADARAIHRVPLEGGEVVPVVELPSTAYSIAIDETGLYWIEGPGTLGPHSIERLRPDGTRLTLASNVQLPFGLSLGPAGVVFTDPYDFTDEPGTVRSVSVDGGATRLVASARPRPQHPFQRDGLVHWVETSDEAFTNRGGIVRAAPDGAGLEKVLTLDRRFPIWATTNGAHYFLTVIDQELGTAVLAARYPVAGPQIVVESAVSGEFYTMVATTPKRLVWTVQLDTPGLNAAGGVRSRCLGALPLP